MVQRSIVTPVAFYLRSHVTRKDVLTCMKTHSTVAQKQQFWSQKAAPLAAGLSPSTGGQFSHGEECREPLP